jgi:multicomponent Na+:H+ antiporter subunit D
VRHLLGLVVAAPLVAASAAVVLRHRVPWPRVFGFAAIGAQLVMAVLLVRATASGEVVALRVGDWPAPFAITLAADLFSALMLLVAAAMVAVCTAFAVARGDDHQAFFYPLVLVLSAGVAGAFVTADLFNLFVFFELMLIASYVLLTLGGRIGQLRAGTVYVSVNLLASTLFLIAVAVMYGVTGTVNMAALATEVSRSGAATFAGALLLVSFGMKASLVPVHGWLPVSYPQAPPSIAALFSGLLTKVGVYALFRVYSIVFAGEASFRPVLLVVAGATMLLGVFGAVGRDGMREILSFHIVSQVGYMIMGLGLFGTLGLAGGIFYVLHHIVVKTSLFLVAGAVETEEGTGVLDRLGGIALRRPWLAASFAVAAFSLAGLPPFSGFFAKLALVRAAVEDGAYAIAAVSILVSFFTLFSMLKIWNGVFWGEAPQASRERVRGARSLVAPAAVLAAASVVMGLAADRMLVLSRTAATVLMESRPYVEAVLGGAS